ncbi:MAG: GyrI-like domain-containing protein [Anaerolineales bacterium]
MGIANLPPIRVVHKLCVFSGNPKRYPDPRIRKSFQSLREWLVGYGLDPDDLLHIGIPTLDNDDLVTYDCCIEFPLPIDDESEGIRQELLPGGRYAILRIEKKPNKITKAIREFRGDYIPDNQLDIDASRPVYEFYYVDTMEYCVPIIGD